MYNFRQVKVDPVFGQRKLQYTFHLVHNQRKKWRPEQRIKNVFRLHTLKIEQNPSNSNTIV